MKNLYLVFAFIIILLASSCGNNSGSTTNSVSTNNQIEETTNNQAEKTIINQVEETINGTYTYSDNSVELEITVSGDRWYGKTMIVTGFGSDYDSQNTVRDNGIVNGNDLYESSGMVKIGYISGKSLTTSIGGNYVTLRKK